MKNLLVIVLFGCAVWQSVWADDSSIAIPENARLAWISNSFNQDGMLLSIQTFNSQDSVEEVLDFYRQTWFKEGDVPGFVENTMGEWSIISQLQDDSNVVLQLKTTESGASQGFLSEAQMNHGRRVPDAKFPIPDDTERFSKSYVEEDDAQVHTMTFLSKQSVGNTVNFYRSSMAKKGWKLARDKEVEGTQIMLFNRRADRCELVVSRLDNESTVIHVNQVKRDG